MKVSFVIVSSFLWSLNCIVESKTHPGDIAVLMDLKSGFDPISIPPGSCLSSWDFAVDPCDYIFSDRFTCGIRCDVIVYGSSRVTEISLDQAGYNGSLSHSSAWNLPYLDVLDVSFNSLSGDIPVAVSNLTRLRRFSLSRNSFTGSIPGSIGSLLYLQELFLDNNRLTGSIPPSFNGLVRLKRLELQNNNLSGELPNLSRLGNLYFVDLSDNSISGKFAAVFPRSVIELSIRNNYLTGRIAGNTVSELRYLQVLDLSHNELSGRAPAALFRHRSLQQLTLSHNNFSLLQIPEDRGVLSKLIAIDLSYNKLRGSLPEFMASLPMLSALSLEHNKFSGTIPTQYATKAVIPKAGTASFERLLLGGNYLFGPVPGPLWRLKPGSSNVSLVDNCLYRCPEEVYVCHGGIQKSPVDCNKFKPMIP
nr:MDIS1-interacting receptor like kinase 2-like [Ipomoea trifida]